DLVDGVRRRMVDGEVLRTVHLERERGDVAFARARRDIRAVAAADDVGGADGRQERRGGGERLARAVRAVESEPDGAEHAVVRLDHGDMPAELGAVLVAVGKYAASAVL